jgi:hypothetical protein
MENGGFTASVLLCAELEGFRCARALVRNAHTVGGNRRIRKCRATCGPYRIGRLAATPGQLVDHVRSNIEVQPNQWLIQISNLCIKIVLRRATPREVTVGSERVLQRTLERLIRHARHCQYIHRLTTADRTQCNRIPILRTGTGGFATGDRHGFPRSARREFKCSQNKKK